MRVLNADRMKMIEYRLNYQKKKKNETHVDYAEQLNTLRHIGMEQKVKTRLLQAKSLLSKEGCTRKWLGVFIWHQGREKKTFVNSIFVCMERVGKE